MIEIQCADEVLKHISWLCWERLLSIPGVHCVSLEFQLSSMFRDTSFYATFSSPLTCFVAVIIPRIRLTLPSRSGMSRPSTLGY